MEDEAAPIQPPVDAEPRLSPKTNELLLSTFAELYRQELGAEEDVHRTLPFFATALGLVVGAVAYAASRMPRWPDLPGPVSHVAFIAAVAFLSLSVVASALVLYWISRAVTRRPYQRIGPETQLTARAAELRAWYHAQGVVEHDSDLANDMQETLIESYCQITMVNREVNAERYRFRALAAARLVLALICALAATSVIFVADKTGVFPKVGP